MSDRGDASRRPPRAPMTRRTRKRWLMAAGAAACWALLLFQTGSLLTGTALLLLIVALGAGAVVGLRAVGVTGAHPWVQRARSRPWRDGQDVLQLALRHLPEVFVITPGGTLLAPNSIELWLNPRDFGSLSEVMDIGLVNASAAEAYQEQVEAHGARFARPGVAGVRVIGEASVPPGRYRLRQAGPLEDAPGQESQLAAAGRVLAPPPAQPGGFAAGPAGQPGPPRAPRAADGWPYAHDGYTHSEPESAGTVVTGLPTMAEQDVRPVPVLRLVTGGMVRETRTSGARAGRGDVELVLPPLSTVSREHGRFTYADGHWWVENLGRNGITLNGTPLTGQRPVSDGDTIRWGSKPDALMSRVELG